MSRCGIMVYVRKALFLHSHFDHVVLVRRNNEREGLVMRGTYLSVCIEGKGCYYNIPF